jgi:hypothetical protein
MTTQIQTRPFRSALITSALALVVGIAISMLYVARAHAGVAEAAPLAPAMAAVSWDPMVWLAIVLAGVLGLRTVIDGLIIPLKAIAPKTETKIDDEVLDFLRGAHDKLDQVLAVLPGAPAAMATVTNVSVAPVGPAALAAEMKAGTAVFVSPPSPGAQPGFVARGMLAFLALAGLLIACTQCTAVQHGGTALVNCIGEDIGTTPGADVATLVAIGELVTSTKAKCTPPGEPISWLCVEGEAIAHGKQIGGCTIVKLVDEFLAPAPGRAAPPPEQGLAARGALEDFRAKVAGGAAFHFKDADR